mgnify:CR=1 FL=1
MSPQFLGSLLWLALLFGIMYFLLIRPQQQQQRRRQQMLDSLREGDRIVTTGGLHGTILRIRGEELTVRIADQVDVKLSRSGVAYKLERES